MKVTVRAMCVALSALAMSACSHLPDMPNVTDTATTTPDASPRARVRTAIELLGQGDEQRARTELRAALEAQPNNGAAQRLLEQIESDPRALLGGNARAYTVQPGETMSEIAERFLGDALLFYALARYNDVDAPNQVSAGQTLMIPHRPGIAPQQAASRPSARVETPVSAATPRSPNAARANQLRLEALQHLNTGQVDSAVTLLRQAQALDANNPAIQRDLDRAVRLQTSLRSRAG
jgi:hypothetical protein